MNSQSTATRSWNTEAVEHDPPIVILARLAELEAEIARGREELKGMVGWSTVQLGEHAALIRGITFKPVDKCAPEDDGAIVCMRTKNVQVTLDQADLIAVPRTLVKSPDKMLSEGDILVSSANSWNLVGKCCQVRDLHFPSTAGGFISILRPTTQDLDAGYLYRWFSSDRVQATLRSFGNQTTNISNLNHKRTLKLQLPSPGSGRAEADRRDSRCSRRFAGQAPRVPRWARYSPPIHLPRHVWRPRHQSHGVGCASSGRLLQDGLRWHSLSQKHAEIL